MGKPEGQKESVEKPVGGGGESVGKKKSGKVEEEKTKKKFSYWRHEAG